MKRFGIRKQSEFYLLLIRTVNLYRIIHKDLIYLKISLKKMVSIFFTRTDL